MSRRVKSGVGTLLVLAIFGVLFLNRQWVKDQYVVRSTTLSSASAQIGSDIELTDGANFIYHASLPEVSNATEFNAACRNVVREQSIVLGCYTQQRLYVYDITDERLNGVKQVTAAHELLHAEYERMSSSEREKVNALLEATANSINDQRFKDTVAEYRRTEPGQIDNELHSIIGTEITVIPSELERHYQKYFKNRQKIVNYAKAYESTFTELGEQIKQYDTQLDALKKQKEQLEPTLNLQQSSIESESKRLSNLRGNGDNAAYNASVPGYNASVKKYNDDIASLRAIVARYNDVVTKRNQLATTQNDLTKQLDSNYRTLQ